MQHGMQASSRDVSSAGHATWGSSELVVGMLETLKTKSSNWILSVVDVPFSHSSLQHQAICCRAQFNTPKWCPLQLCWNQQVGGGVHAYVGITLASYLSSLAYNYLVYIQPFNLM